MEKLTVVFDLDETLVSVKQNTQDANYELPVKVKDKIVKVVSLEPVGDILQAIPQRASREYPKAIRSSYFHFKREGIRRSDYKADRPTFQIFP
jgi:FMN phosphatase YigB (HAD superfamily)